MPVVVLWAQMMGSESIHQLFSSVTVVRGSQRLGINEYLIGWLQV